MEVQPVSCCSHGSHHCVQAINRLLQGRRSTGDHNHLFSLLHHRLGQFHLKRYIAHGRHSPLLPSSLPLRVFKEKCALLLLLPHNLHLPLLLRLPLPLHHHRHYLLQCRMRS